MQDPIYESNLMLLATPIIEMYADGIKGAEFYNSCSDFFNYTQDIRPNKLLGCNTSALLPIGSAFAILAIEIDFGNPNINSISAENALYCFIRHYKEKPDSFGNLPFNAVASLLLDDPSLMRDGLIHVLRSHPYYLIDFSERLVYNSGENSVRYRILRYLIPYFFDIEKKEFIIEDLPLAPPKRLVLECVNSSWYKNANPQEGEGLLEELYSFCKLGVSHP